MSSKIKVDTIENVAGSGNVSLGSGHNLVVPGDLTVDTSTLKVDASNNRVGIGTTTPVRDLGIGTHGTSGGPEIALGSTTTGFGSVLFGDGATGTDFINNKLLIYNYSTDRWSTGSGQDLTFIQSASQEAFNTLLNNKIKLIHENLIDQISKKKISMSKPFFSIKTDIVGENYNSKINKIRNFIKNIQNQILIVIHMML